MITTKQCSKIDAYLMILSKSM